MATAVSPKPSFHLCPDFNIPPPPNGHLQLGSVLAKINIDSVLAPLNSGTNIPVSEADLYPRDGPDVKEGFSRSLRDLRSQKASIWASIFGSESAGVSFSFFRERDNDETLTVKKVFVRYFLPTDDYTEKALKVDSVALYVRATKRKRPVYIVTGLMWVEGAKLSKLHSRNIKANAQASVTEPHTGTEGVINGMYDSENRVGMSFDGSSPFVLGIRVRKIWWDRRGNMRTTGGTVGATLAENTGPQPELDHGLQYVDDEEFDPNSGITIIDETLTGEEGTVVWVLT